MDSLVEIAKIQSTEASNKIEGIVTTRTRIKQLFDEKTTPRNRDDEIMGYRDVLNTIHESSEYIPIRPSYILQLHRDLLKRAGFSHGGRFKNVQNSINETKPDGTMVTRFTPVAPYDASGAVENLCNAYEQAIAKEEIDSLILLLLYKNGYMVGKYISIEKQIEKTKDRYYDAIEEFDAGWHEEENDPSPFVRYILQAILARYTEFEECVGLMTESCY